MATAAVGSCSGDVPNAPSVRWPAPASQPLQPDQSVPVTAPRSSSSSPSSSCPPDSAASAAFSGQAGITVDLAFLYGYFGQAATDLLGHRLAGVLTEGAFGVLAAWVVLPVRTTDTVRPRLRQLLATVTTVSSARGTLFPRAVLRSG